MPPLGRLLLLSARVLLQAGLLAAASPVARRTTPSFKFQGDAPFSVDDASLASTLTCPNGHPTSSSPPVLLVHGTATTGIESWGDTYVPALKANGYTACYITIPDRAMNDMQVNAEYVAYNMHYISSLAGGLPTAVISHSQGGPNTQWALQFWPSTRNVTSAFVALAPDLAGIELGDSLLSKVCSTGVCQAAVWQQSAGSNYYNALHANGFQAQVPTTSIYTDFDGIITPSNGNAQLPGATVISVQSLCALRPDSHVTMTFSSAAYSLALDALNNGGEASLSRVKKNWLSICLRVTAKDMRLSLFQDSAALLENLIKGFIKGTKVKSEPSIDSYAVSATNLG